MTGLAYSVLSARLKVLPTVPSKTRKTRVHLRFSALALPHEVMCSFALRLGQNCFFVLKCNDCDV